MEEGGFLNLDDLFNDLGGGGSGVTEDHLNDLDEAVAGEDELSSGDGVGAVHVGLGESLTLSRAYIK